MNENIIKFESSAEKTGFHELESLFLNLSNHYIQAVETPSGRDPEYVKADESNAIAQRLSELIADLDGLRPHMPDVPTFRSYARKFIMLPFGDGPTRSSSGYLGLDELVDRLATEYSAKVEELQTNRLQDALS